MATKDNNLPDQPNKPVTNTFDKGMMMDFDDMLTPLGVWLRARNAVNNSDTGHIGVLGNEPSNVFCKQIDDQLIVMGLVYITDGSWLVMSTDNSVSELGIYKDNCTYSRLFRDNNNCLNFSTAHLVKGVSKENFDCTRQIYWDDDAYNSSRTIGIKANLLAISDEYFVNNKTVVDGCEIDNYDFTTLDCNKLRLAPYVGIPTVTLNKSNYSGSLLNGSYQVFIAYTVNNQRVTDYVGYSNVQSLFTHENVNSSLDVNITNIDDNFDEFELVIVRFFNQQASAKQVGYYSTKIWTISIDYFNESLVSIPISQIPLVSTVYERSEAMYNNGDYLLRVAPTGYFDFNYQPLANQITTKWFATAYPEDYYYKGGNKTTHLRDEVYTYFIRWVYDSGYKSPSFHIPGRAKTTVDSETNPFLINFYSSDPSEAGSELWQVKNTATITNPPLPLPLNYVTGIGSTPDGGVIVAEGDMSYWESTEQYPNDQPDIWGDLCGKPIRHHKYPDIDIIPHFVAEDNEIVVFPVTVQQTCLVAVQPNTHVASKAKNFKIVLLNPKFDNILPPVDNNGLPIPGISGYEILRGTREGNKTIIAKGVLTNLREYSLPEYTEVNSPNPKKGLFLNYPFNDLRQDELLSKIKVDGGCGTACDITRYPMLDSFSTNYVAFHSPDTNFGNPFLEVDELKITGELQGVAEGYFTEVKNHPKHALPNDLAFIIASLFGLISSFNYTLFSGTFSGTADFYTEIGSNITAMANKPPIDDLPIGVDDIVSAIMKPIATFYYAVQITQGYLDAMLALMSDRQYALQHKSHCFYSKIVGTHQRSKINKSVYVGPHRQEIDQNYVVNNVYRTNYVLLNANKTLLTPTILPDTSRYSIHKVKNINKITYNDPVNKNIRVSSSCMYSTLKLKIRNLYGQLESIRQIPVSPYLFPYSFTPSSTGYSIFCGDNYIGRYTEKNTFFFFYDWLLKQPNGYEFDYRKYAMIPYPRYWINSEKYNTSDILNNIFPGLACNDSSSGGISYLNDITYEQSVPSDNASVTRDNTTCYSGSLKDIFCSNDDALLRIDGWFYLFYSGVKDFFVESEINLAQRDHESDPEKRFYDSKSYTDLNALFDSSIVKESNFYKYDKSLSISKYSNVFPAWGVMHTRDYNPDVAETCYQYFPKRVIYSLPRSKENKKDYWRNFLAYNYKDFSSKVTSISPIAKNGAMLHFKDMSPIQFVGVDTLQTDIGTKITVGDGGLFSQPLQNIVNTDNPYEYGSCQDRLSIINTPFGIFWISQDQGKIFQYVGKLKEISAQGMRWWFNKYLKYELLNTFPNFNNLQNPVNGIGCQATYDNKNEIIYFTKKDYKYIGDQTLIYTGDSNFVTERGFKVTLTDTRFFKECSWTISYDPKNEAWISFHDWHPNLIIPERNTFTTIKGGQFWKHNDTCLSYCNFYGVDYPFEIETIANTGQTVTTSRSIEYIMEAYRYTDNCYDNHHLLDYNFDKMIIYNSEQISGDLNLILSPKNNPYAIITYPLVNPNSIDVLYSKEENKYRIDQFWDITADRGEYSGAQNILWVTEPNGYVKNILPGSVNYTKAPLEHKKFRHYSNKVIFKRTISNNIKMFFKIINVKQNPSAR